MHDGSIRLRRDTYSNVSNSPIARQSKPLYYRGIHEAVSVIPFRYGLITDMTCHRYAVLTI